MIGLMSSKAPGLVTEINDPRQLLLPDATETIPSTSSSSL